MPIYRFNGLTPVVHPSAFVHPTAVLIGDVQVAAGAYVGPCASLRGDFGRVIVGPGSNVQDTCVMHAFPDRDVCIERNGHIGHGAVLHGCTVAEDALVGMNAVVMDEALIGSGAFVGACSFVPAKFHLPAGHLALGTPARVVRELTDQERNWKSAGTAEYQGLARLSLTELTEVQPLTEVEADRPRMDISRYQFKPD